MDRVKLPRLGFAAIAAATALVVASCGAASSGKADGGSPATGTATIGLALPLSGAQAVIGVPISQGMELGFADQEKQSGVKYKIEKYDDGGGDPGESVNIAQRIISHVTVLAGSVNSANSLAMMPLAQRQQVPELAFSTSPALTSHGNKFIFRMLNSDAVQVSALIDYARTHGKTRVALITDQSDFGAGGRNAALASLKEHNLGPAADTTFRAGDQDFTSQVLTVRNSKPDAILIWGLVAEAARITDQLRQQGVNSTLLLSLAAASPQYFKLTGAASDGAIAPLATVASGPATVRFKAEYFSRFGKDADFFAAVGYDAATAIATAIRNAKSLDPKKVVTALRAVQIDGAAGHFGFTKTGENTRRVTLGIAKDAVLTPIG